MEKILTNLRNIDPSQKIDEIGNIIIDEKGKIKSIGKKTKLTDASKTAEKIDSDTPQQDTTGDKVATMAKSATNLGDKL